MFDEERCEKGLGALAEYHKKWDEDRKEYLAMPDHNWASHGADAFRTSAASTWEQDAWEGGHLINSDPHISGMGREIEVLSDFDPREI